MADKLIYEEASDWITYSKCFSGLQRKKEYDALFLLYAIWINKKIDCELSKIKVEKEYDKLNEKISPREMYEYREKIKSWQEELRNELLKNIDYFWKCMMEEYSRVDDIPMGLKDYVYIVGRNLVYSATYYDEKFERDWNIICTMLALQYPSYAQENIKEKYRDEYINANSFLIENKVSLSKFYVLCWDIYKTAEDHDRKERDESYKHNFVRMSKILSDLPEIYRLVLAGKELRPTCDRKKAICVDGEGNAVMEQILSVPFYLYLPSFTDKKTNNEYWDNYSPNKELQKHRVCHPLTQVTLPCTELFLRTDVDLYIESIYRKVEFQRIEERISKFEPRLSGIEDQKISPNFKTIEIPERDTLLLKLSNRANRTSELMTKFQNRENAVEPKVIRERLNKVGFSRKTFWELTTYRRPGEKKVLPDKDTLIAVACAMELSKEDAERLLISAGYIFSPAVERDMIILHCLENSVYNIEAINDILVGIEMNPIRGKKEKMLLDK